jgi:hypothetical protein
MLENSKYCGATARPAGEGSVRSKDPEKIDVGEELSKQS